MDFPIIINWASPLSFLGVLGFLIFISFFDEIPPSKQNSPRCDAALGYAVCLCPIKGTPGLNELKYHNNLIKCVSFISE